MKIFFDTEFIEDGKTIDLISIGMIREDGRRLYAENSECDYSKASDWVKQNVLPHLSGANFPSIRFYRPEIARAIVNFVGPEPEFWAYYADYDWVVLCQLFGTMMDLPKGWPMFCMDIKQWCCMMGDPELPGMLGNEHNAMDDAIWCKDAYDFLHQRALTWKFN